MENSPFVDGREKNKTMAEIKKYKLFDPARGAFFSATKEVALQFIESAKKVEAEIKAEEKDAEDTKGSDKA